LKLLGHFLVYYKKFHGSKKFQLEKTPVCFLVIFPYIMLLSKKVLDEFKRINKSDLQVEKDTRITLREQAVLFGLSIQLASRSAMEKAKRKAYKLTDVVNGFVTVLQASAPTENASEWVNAIFKTSVAVKPAGEKPVGYQDATFTDQVLSGLFSKDEQNVIHIDHLNTLRISEVENMLKTPRKASRITNAFLAKAIDKYVFYQLTQAEKAATADKKKRITRQHLTLLATSDSLQEALVKYTALKTSTETAGGDEDAAATESKDSKPDDAKKSVTIASKDNIIHLPPTGPEYSEAVGSAGSVLTTSAPAAAAAAAAPKQTKKRKAATPVPEESTPAVVADAPLVKEAKEAKVAKVVKEAKPAKAAKTSKKSAAGDA
jgi:hypothetical protein